MSGVKTAEDVYQNKLQFGHIRSEDYQNITTAVVFNANYDQHIEITPTTGDAWVGVEAATFTPATGEGKLIPFGSGYTMIIRAGEYIGSDTEINVVPLGEL